MASMRDIKRRIKSVGSTQQITKAMNLVSASKLTRAKQRLNETKPFFQETKRVIAGIVKSSKGISHRFLDERPVNKTGVIVLTGDRGLCGGYNANVCKAALGLIYDKSNVSVITVGTKAKDYFKRRQKNIVKHYAGISEKPFYEDATVIADYILDEYLNNNLDEVYLAYTEFKSAISADVKLIKILPVDTSGFDEGDTPSRMMNYDPDPETVLDYVIPKYVNTVIFGALVESATCEQGARMTAMDTATENAEEMIGSLTLLYNRARQSAITQEITEIVGGANALK